MKINRPLIKLTAKKYITTIRPSPVIFTLVYILIVYILEYLTSRLNGYEQVLNDFSRYYYSGNDLSRYIPELPVIPWYATAIIIAISLMSLMLSIGFSIYSLNVANRRNASFANLFDGFNIFLKVIWLQILAFVFVFLWSLIFIVPGIVASYRYRQALFIMIENPDMSALECIRASKKMMYGHKGELFVMDLSFLGWYLLTAVPFVSIWVLPYTEISYAIYYIALRDIPAGPQIVDI